MPSPTPPRRIEFVPIAYLAPNPWQPRQHVREEDLAVLVDSIQRFGFSGHLEVRHDPADPAAKLQLVFGHRRLRAAELAGLTVVPAMIIERSDQEMQQLGYLENATQLPLSYWEEGLFFGRLRDEFGFSIRILADHLNVSKGYVQNRLDLLKLSADSPIRQAAGDGAIELTAALTMQSLARIMPRSQIDALLAQLRTGTLTGNALTQIKLETERRTKEAPTSQPVEPTGERQEASASPEAPVGPGAEIFGVTGVGRFADLVLSDDARSEAVEPRPNGPRPLPCGQDVEWLIATGRLQPDGSELEPQEAATQSTHELLHLLRRQIPRFERLGQVASVDLLAFPDRAEFAELVRRMFEFGEAVRTVEFGEQPEASQYGRGLR